MTAEQGFTGHETETAQHPLVRAAISDALSRLPEKHSLEAESRIRRGIENRLGPAILESEIIGDQLSSPEYKNYVAEMNEFFQGAKVGTVICPDGRINPYLSLGDPSVMAFHQRLAGIPEVRPSTSSAEGYVLNDPNITGALVSSVRRGKKKNAGMELVEFLGPHINSDAPSHGCGALGIIVGKDQLIEIGMRFGAIDRYYRDLGNGFFAFNNAASSIKELQVPSTTFDISHDAHSQGLIYGLRDVHKDFNANLSLRENLVNASNQGEIVMTEFLDHAFRDKIVEIDNTIYPEGGKVEPLDPTKLAENIMRIGRIAKEITKQEEEKGFQFIPRDLIEGKSDTAKRVLAYMLIRNVVYRTLSNIQPGNHALMEHNERWIRVGSSGPSNIGHVPFVLRTQGSLRDGDIQEVFALESILRDSLKRIGVKPLDEATVIVVGATFDPSIYASRDIAQEQKDVTFSTVGNDAARIRNARPADIENGNRVVLGALFCSDRTITEIVR